MKKASGPVTRQQVACTYKLEHAWRHCAGVGWFRCGRCGLVAVCSKCCAAAGVVVPVGVPVFGCERHGAASVRSPLGDVTRSAVQRVKPHQDSF